MELPVLSPESPARPACIALIGNPNAGKTTLFNALTGLRAKTANFPGITVDLRRGQFDAAGQTIDLIDLPGLYSLDALSPEEQVAEDFLRGDVATAEAPDAVLLVLDATNLQRNLFLASEILDLQLPTVVALSFMDAVGAAKTDIDVEQLAAQLNCPVVPVSSRTGAGLDTLRETLARFASPERPVKTEDHVSCVEGCTGCTFAARHDWAGRIAQETVSGDGAARPPASRLDRLLTNPFLGVLAFLAVMLGVFYVIFSLADVPMTLIDEGFGAIAATVDGWIPTDATTGVMWKLGTFLSSLALFAIGYRLSRIRWSTKSTLAAVAVSTLVSGLPVEDFKSLLIDGVIGGVGGVVIFLPQICILFFCISLLEDSGYMARAAFVMERLMRKVGLPGKAFVPMLSAHACAIPGIMAARVIEDWRDRLVTILVLPLLTCSARLPVYAMVAALLFADEPGKAALVFVAAYTLGIAATLLSAWALKKTVLKGESQPLVLELPPYRRPSLRNALLMVIDRGMVFLRKAGTAILLISVILWTLATYPKLDEAHLPTAVASDVSSLREQAATADGDNAEALSAEADQLIAQAQLSHSFAGRAGRFVEPLFRPLGFDWKINVGVISSFAAREVIVSTLAIVYGIGEDAAEDESTLVETLRRQRRADGTPVFTTATCVSLLVFYVLAMQCLPTQVVTKRETGSWKWAIFQFTFMTVLAYTASLIAYQTAQSLGIA